MDIFDKERAREKLLQVVGEMTFDALRYWLSLNRYGNFGYEIEAIQYVLDVLVEEEDYERAAVVRDVLADAKTLGFC